MLSRARAIILYSLSYLGEGWGSSYNSAAAPILPTLRGDVCISRRNRPFLLAGILLSRNDDTERDVGPSSHVLVFEAASAKGQV